MTWPAETLWHLLGLVRPRRPARRPARRTTMRDRYAALVADMKSRYGLRVNRWRRRTSGCAWVVRYHDGTESRLIEAPYPCGPVSCAVFLHEVGHHAIGFGTHRLRCLEEYHAWVWALQVMRREGFNVTAAVERRVEESVRYAVRRALRSGLRTLPPELTPYAADRRRQGVPPRPA